MTRARTLAIPLVFAASVLHAQGVAAHDRSASRVSVIVAEDGARVSIELRAIDRSALRGSGVVDAASLEAHLTSAVRLASERGTCVPMARSFTEIAAAPGATRWEWRVACAGAPTRLRALPVPARPSHVCFARVTPADAEAPIAAQDLVLSELAPEVALRGTPPSAPEAFARFVPIGVEHILGGLDHLVFLLVLLLAARSLRDAALLATGFTVGHSITLAAAALGAVQTEPRLVEALIGFSIALVAVEHASRTGAARSGLAPAVTVAAIAVAAAYARSLALAGVALASACHLALAQRTPGATAPVTQRAAVAGAFGLLHGLGFAGALRENGLPDGDAVVALLGFNVGVELGQIAIVALAWPAYAWSRRVETRHELGARLVAAAGVCAGTFWFVTRLLG